MSDNRLSYEKMDEGKALLPPRLLHPSESMHLSLLKKVEHLSLFLHLSCYTDVLGVTVAQHFRAVTQAALEEQ